MSCPYQFELVEWWNGFLHPRGIKEHQRTTAPTKLTGYLGTTSQGQPSCIPNLKLYEIVGFGTAVAPSSVLRGFAGAIEETCHAAPAGRAVAALVTAGTGTGLGLQGLDCRAWTAGLGLQGLDCRAWTAGLGLQGSQRAQDESLGQWQAQAMPLASMSAGWARASPNQDVAL